MLPLAIKGLKIFSSPNFSESVCDFLSRWIWWSFGASSHYRHYWMQMTLSFLWSLFCLFQYLPESYRIRASWFEKIQEMGKKTLSTTSICFFSICTKYSSGNSKFSSHNLPNNEWKTSFTANATQPLFTMCEHCVTLYLYH